MNLHWETQDSTELGPDDKPIIRTYEQVSLQCGSGFYLKTVCINNCPPGSPPRQPAPDPYQLALLLADRIDYHIPDPTFSPDISRPGARMLVGLPVFWAIPAYQFETLSLSAWACNDTACTSAWARATPEYVYFVPDDEDRVVTTCRRIGDVVRSKSEAANAAESGDCMYTYDVAGIRNGKVGIHYTVMGGASGGATFTLDPQDSETSVVLPVVEYQPVIVR